MDCYPSLETKHLRRGEHSPRAWDHRCVGGGAEAWGRAVWLRSSHRITAPPKAKPNVVLGMAPSCDEKGASLCDLPLQTHSASPAMRKMLYKTPLRHILRGVWAAGRLPEKCSAQDPPPQTLSSLVLSEAKGLAFFKAPTDSYVQPGLKYHQAHVFPRNRELQNALEGRRW